LHYTLICELIKTYFQSSKEIGRPLP